MHRRSRETLAHFFARFDGICSDLTEHEDTMFDFLYPCTQKKQSVYLQLLPRKIGYVQSLVGPSPGRGSSVEYDAKPTRITFF
jgi:hypothetical protein